MKQQNKNLLKFIVPAVIGQVCFFLFTIIDGIFVGNGIGENALGAVNIVMPFVMTVNALYMLITVGGVTVYAVRSERGDKDALVCPYARFGRAAYHIRYNSFKTAWVYVRGKRYIYRICFRLSYLVFGFYYPIVALSFISILRA